MYPQIYPSVPPDVEKTFRIFSDIKLPRKTYDISLDQTSSDYFGLKNGAVKKTRTSKRFPPPAPQAGASTNSAMTASWNAYGCSRCRWAGSRVAVLLVRTGSETDERVRHVRSAHHWLLVRQAHDHPDDSGDAGDNEPP
jgi:hypothetical protein